MRAVAGGGLGRATHAAADRARAGAAVLALIVGALAGCGVPAQSDAVLADDEDVPFGLLARTETSSPVPATGTAVAVFLLGDSGRDLVGVARLAPTGSLASRLRVLAQGPTPGEAANGLRSAVPGPDVVSSASLVGGVATVDLSTEFAELTGAEQQLAIAQIVYTLTDRSDVERVAFTLDGEAVQVPRGDGSLTSEPVSRSDYAELVG